MYTHICIRICINTKTHNQHAFNNIHTYIFVCVCVCVSQLYFRELYLDMTKQVQFKFDLTIYIHTYTYKYIYMCLSVCVAAALFPGALSRYDKTNPIQIAFKSAFNNILTYIQIYIYIFVCVCVCCSSIFWSSISIWQNKSNSNCIWICI